MSPADTRDRRVSDTVRSFFIPLVCSGLLLSGLAHLLFPDRAERHLSRATTVRVIGAILLALILPALVWGYAALAVLFAIFGVPRLVAPERSVRLQQQLYPRRVHGVLLLLGGACLWIASRLLHR